MTKKVLILGGGFGGVRAALDLYKEENLKITLINKEENHCYIPDLYELSTAKIEKNTKKEYFKVFNSVNIPLKEIFKGKSIEVLIDTITGIDLPNSKVSTAASGKLAFDYLIIALGCETSYFGIEGAWEHSHPLKTTEDALNLRNDLEELLEVAKENKKKLEVVIAGGGFTGVELAAQIKSKFGGSLKVVILEATSNVLGGMPSWAQAKALERLKVLGVIVVLEEKILKVTKNKVLGSGKSYPFDYLIWTTGVKGVSLRTVVKGAEFNKKSQFIVEESLNLTLYPKVYVCGDIAQVMDSKKKSFAPPAAWAAIGESKVVAQNIKKDLRGKKLSKYNPPNSVFVVPLGGNFAISNAFNLRFIGFSPWFIKQFIALRYFLGILPFFKALEVWWRGAKDQEGLTNFKVFINVDR